MTDQLDESAQLLRCEQSVERLIEAGIALKSQKQCGLSCHSGAREAVASVEDRQISGLNGSITVRIYRGIGAPSGR